MPSGVPADLIMLYKATATGAGLVIGDGVPMRYGSYLAGGGKPNQNLHNKYGKIFCLLSDSVTGASATVQVQTAPDNVTWTTIQTFTLTIPGVAPFVKGLMTNNDGWGYKWNPIFIRLNVSAISGGAAPQLNAYMTYGGLGA